MFINKLERAILTFFLLTASLYLSAQLEPVLEVNNERALLAQASQQKIDSFQVKTDKDSSEYKSVSKQIEGLKVYNAQKRKQFDRRNNSNYGRLSLYGLTPKVEMATETAQKIANPVP